MKQYLFCVEADKKSRSDWFYMSEAIKRFYDFDTHKVSIKPIFMGSKSKYNSKDVKKEITQYRRSKNNQTTVFICIDLDDWDKNPEDQKLNELIKQFCKSEKAELIWFCRDIEEVFLSSQVEDDVKIDRAKAFKTKGLIKNVNPSDLSCNEWIKRKSNYLCVLDKYLKRKV